LVRSAMAPETMVAAVAANTHWKIQNDQFKLEVEKSVEAKWLSPMISLPPPNMKPNPMRKNARDPRQKSIRFFIMMLHALLARVNPVSTMAKPACMKNTRNAAMHVQTILRLLVRTSRPA